MKAAKQQQTLVRPAAELTPKTVREFLSTAVHDLREPLRAIRAHTQLLASVTENEQSNRKDQCVKHIHDGVERMENLVRDLENYCLEELRELDMKDLGMEKALLEARRQLAEKIEKSGAVVTHDPLPEVTGDFDSLASVFRILLDNACKFRSAEPPQIHVGAVRDGPAWVFSVRDNGQGFNPTYAELIFKPFERLNGKRYPGSGLGLPLAKRIVERHGGRIWVDSQAEQGSTFRFSLE
jgi:light-regulated signal transduction histidine kinase (bacteriophytochrome)